MASGQQLAEQNFQAFTAWLSSRTDDDFKQMVKPGRFVARKSQRNADLLSVH
jgi:hypothetical protein